MLSCQTLHHYLFPAFPEGVLQGGNVLEAVAGHHPVVVVGCDQEQGGVLTIKPVKHIQYTMYMCTVSPGTRRAH